MGMKLKKKLVAYIATIAMLLSVFNIPILGYATETGDEPNAVDMSCFSVKVGPDYESEPGDSITTEDISQYGGGVSQGFYVDYNEGDLVPEGTIEILSSDVDIVNIWTYRQPVNMDEPYWGGGEYAEIPVSGQYNEEWFELYYNNGGTAEITVSYTDPDGQTTVIDSFIVNVIDEGEVSSEIEKSYGIFVYDENDGLLRVASSYSAIFSSLEDVEGEYFFYVRPYDEDGDIDYETTDFTAEWESSDPSVAECIETGSNDEIKVQYLSKGKTTISAWIDGEMVASFDFYVGIDSEDEGDGEIEEPSEDYDICDICGEYYEDCLCWDASIDSLDLTYTLASGEETTETIYFDKDSSWAEVTLKPYDTDSKIMITGTGANGEAISEEVVFGEDSEYETIEVVSTSPDGHDESWYTVEVYRLIGPVAEVTYYIGDEKVTETKRFGTNDYRLVEIPYAYNSDKDISVSITHVDGTITTHDVEWEYEAQGWVYFDSVVNGEETECTLDIWLPGPSYNNDCSLRIDAFNEDYNYSISIDSQAAASEEGALVTIPYGYTDRVEFHVNPNDDYAKVEDLYNDGEEEKGYVLVSAGETRTFKVVAENGDEKTYSVTFVSSEGTSADIDMHAMVRDNALAESEYGSYRENIAIDFTEDQDGNKSAEVVLPYMYDDESGIELYMDTQDSFSTSFDYETVYLGDDEEETVEFTVTSPDGNETKTYTIHFSKETEEDSSKAELDSFTVGYIDQNGEQKTLDIDAADASDENGAKVIIPETAFSSEGEEYYVDVFAEVSGYGWVHGSETSAYDYSGTNSQGYIKYSVELSHQRAVTVTFDVKASNGQDMTSYKVTIVNGAKANEASINAVTINYTRINHETITESDIFFDDNEDGDVDSNIEFVLKPYDPTKPIYISGESADGSKIYKLVTFEEGKNEAVVKITSKAFDEKTEIEYTITVKKPEHPTVDFYYQSDDCVYGSECEFTSDYQDKVYVPYNYDKEFGINFDIMLLDGTTLEPAPKIVWENEIREDEHDPLIGKIQFEENGHIYTIDIEVEGASTNKTAYMYMYAWDGESYDEWGDEDYIYIDVDEDAAANEEGAIVTIPYGCENDSNFYIYADDEYATVEGYDEDGNEYSNIVKPGETRVYTVTAQDGTTQDYKITFVESAGNSTEIDATICFTNATITEYNYNCYKHLYFEENEDGIMETDIVLPFNFYEEDGIMLYDDSEDDVTYNIPLDEKISIDIKEDPSFEFTVTSPSGNATKDYIINFSKEGEDEASSTALSYAELSYTDKNGYIVESDVDIFEAEDGNIVIELPENIDDNETVVTRFYLDGYTWKSRGVTMISDHELMGKGDTGWFTAEFLRSDSTPIIFEFDITSSNGVNTKTYTVTIMSEDTVCDHEGTIVIDEAVTPTCTEPGLTEGSHCSKCDVVIVEQRIDPAIGHKPGEKATCLVAQTCTVCKIELVPILPHSWEDATCTKPKTCKVCDTSEGLPNGHNMTYRPGYDATCTKHGYHEYWYCSDCYCYFADEYGNLQHGEPPFIEAPGHKMTKHEAVAAKCETTGNIEYYTCDACKLYFVDAEGQIETTAEKVTIPATDHDYVPIITESTCISDGYTTYTCECGDSYIDDYKNPRPHDEVIDKAVAATYFKTGLTEGSHCKVCNEILVKQKTVAKKKYTAVPKTVTANLSTASKGYDDIKVSWSKVSGASGYKVSYKKASSKKWSKPVTVSSKTTSYTFKDLAAGTKYNLKVVPYVKSGKTVVNSTKYKTASTVTLKKISTPKVVKSGSKVKVSWKNIGGESGYQISQSTKKSATKIVATYKTTKGKSKVIKAKKGKKYYYKVRAFKYVKVGKKTYKVYGPWSTAKDYKRR